MMINDVGIAVGDVVRVRRIGRGSFTLAVVERIHACWGTPPYDNLGRPRLFSTDNLPVSYGYPQTLVSKYASYCSLTSPQAAAGKLQLTDCCIHVRFRNNHRACIPGGFVRQIGVIDALAFVSNKESRS